MPKNMIINVEQDATIASTSTNSLVHTFQSVNKDIYYSDNKLE